MLDLKYSRHISQPTVHLLLNFNKLLNALFPIAFKSDYSLTSYTRPFKKMSCNASTDTRKKAALKTD